MPSKVKEVSEQAKEVFQRFDKDGQGTLDNLELRKMLKAIEPRFTSDEVDDICKQLDRSGDGTISHVEFMVWINKGGETVDEVKRALKTETGDARTERIRKAFQRYDKSGDGGLDISELHKVLTMMGSFNNDEIIKICADLDASGDGVVCFEEFDAWVRNGTCEKGIYKAKAILAPSDGDGVEGVFYNFCGAGRCDMDGTSFVKMCKDCSLIDKKTLTAPAAAIIFNNMKVKPKGQRVIEFHQWEIALELLAEKKSIPLDAVRQTVLETTRPMLQGTSTDGMPQVSAQRRALLRSEKEKQRQKRLKQLMRSVTESAEETSVDNSKLWRTFGLSTVVGRSLHHLYSLSHPSALSENSVALPPISSSPHSRSKGTLSGSSSRLTSGGASLSSLVPSADATANQNRQTRHMTSQPWATVVKVPSLLAPVKGRLLM